MEHKIPKIFWMTFFILWNTKTSVFSAFIDSPMLFWTTPTFIVWTQTVETLFKIYSFVLHRGKKVKQVWNDKCEQMMTIPLTTML